MFTNFIEDIHKRKELEKVEFSAQNAIVFCDMYLLRLISERAA